jgi:hypothetical protein
LEVQSDFKLFLELENELKFGNVQRPKLGTTLLTLASQPAAAQLGQHAAQKCGTHGACRVCTGTAWHGTQSARMAQGVVWPVMSQ